MTAPVPEPPLGVTTKRKIRMVIEAEVDAEEWCTEYGIEPREFRRDLSAWAQGMVGTDPFGNGMIVPDTVKVTVCRNLGAY